MNTSIRFAYLKLIIISSLLNIQNHKIQKPVDVYNEKALIPLIRLEQWFELLNHFLLGHDSTKQNNIRIF